MASTGTTVSLSLFWNHRFGTTVSAPPFLHHRAEGELGLVQVEEHDDGDDLDPGAGVGGRVQEGES